MHHSPAASLLLLRPGSPRLCASLQTRDIIPGWKSGYFLMFQEMLMGSHDDSVSHYSLGLLTGTRHSGAWHLHAPQIPDPQAEASSGTHSCPVDGGGTMEGMPLSPLCWDRKRFGMVYLRAGRSDTQTV